MIKMVEINAKLRMWKSKCDIGAFFSPLFYKCLNTFWLLFFFCSLSRAYTYQASVQSSRQQPQCCGGGQTHTTAGFLVFPGHTGGDTIYLSL